MNGIFGLGGRERGAGLVGLPCDFGLPGSGADIGLGFCLPYPKNILSILHNPDILSRNPVHLS